MSNESFGDISLADYRRIAGVPRRMPRWATAALGVAACMLCTAAGDYAGLWSGKNAKELEFKEGMYLLGHPEARTFQTEGGMHAVSRCIRSGLEELARHGERDDKLGEYARTYLLQLAIRSTQLIEKTTTSDKEKDTLERNLPRRSKGPK